MGVSVFDTRAMRHDWRTEETRAILDERARLQKWLDIEAARDIAPRPRSSGSTSACSAPTSAGSRRCR